MTRAALLLLVLTGVSCDVGELNPQAFDETPYHPSDWMGGDPGPVCNNLCDMIGSCYGARPGVELHCASLCGKGFVNIGSCEACLSGIQLNLQYCALLEAGACQVECAGGGESLTAESSWQRATIGCGSSYGCVERPACSVNSSTSAECISGCCAGNLCVPACVCSGMLLPSGC